MNGPMFEIRFENGPLDGLTITSDILPADHLTLPARPDRMANIGAIRQPIESPLAHYELALGTLKAGHDVPVVQFRYQFRGLTRGGNGLPRLDGRLNWFQRLRGWLCGAGPSLVDFSANRNRLA